MKLGKYEKEVLKLIAALLLLKKTTRISLFYTHCNRISMVKKSRCISTFQDI